MKKTLFILILPLITCIAFGQQKEQAEKLVEEGIAYHDKGDYDGALSKYESALKLDKDNLRALAEKAYTLNTLEKFEEAITVCKLAIEKHPGELYLPTVYVTYGNSLDGLKKTDESIAIYEAGIQKFPNEYQLYFNKGVTLASVKKYDEALLSFQKAVTINPKHASSHNAIAHLLDAKQKRIPSLLAYCRFLIIEPQTKRSKDNLASMQVIMKGNVEQTGKKSMTINISSDMLGDTTADGKPNENSFTSTDLLLAMDAAMDHDKKYKKNTEVEQFIRKFATVCSSLKETQKDNYGFYWDYYVPYFVEMKDKNLIETFAYVAFATSEDPEVTKWLKANQTAIDTFYAWSKKYSWEIN